MNKKNKIIRQLGGQELYWLLSEAYRPFNIQAEVRVKNKIDAKILEKALSIIQKQQPLLTVFFDLSGFPAYLKTEKTIPLYVYSGKSDIEIKEMAKQDLMRSTVEENAPLMRVSLFFFKDECVLVFTIHHLIAGGVELSYLVRDVLDYIDRLNKKEIISGKKYEFPPIVESMMPVGMAEYHAPDSFQFVRKQNQKNISTEKVNVKFTADESSHLATKSKKQESSLFSVILSAASFALRDFLNEVYQEAQEEIMSHVPLNFRSMLTSQLDARELGSYLYGVSLDFNPGEYSNDWEYAQHIKKEVKLMTKDPSIIGNILKNIYAQLQTTESQAVLTEKVANKRASKPVVSVSNLGVLPFPKKIGKIELISIFFATNATWLFDSNSAFFIIMYSFGGELHLEVLYSYPTMSTEKAMKYVENLKKRILSLIGE